AGSLYRLAPTSVDAIVGTDAQIGLRPDEFALGDLLRGRAWQRIRELDVTRRLEGGQVEVAVAQDGLQDRLVLRLSGLQHDVGLDLLPARIVRDRNHGGVHDLWQVLQDGL